MRSPRSGAGTRLVSLERAPSTKTSLKKMPAELLRSRSRPSNVGASEIAVAAPLSSERCAGNPAIRCDHGVERRVRREKVADQPGDDESPPAGTPVWLPAGAEFRPTERRRSRVPSISSITPRSRGSPSPAAAWSSRVATAAARIERSRAADRDPPAVIGSSPPTRAPSDTIWSPSGRPGTSTWTRRSCSARACSRARMLPGARLHERPRRTAARGARTRAAPRAPPGRCRTTMAATPRPRSEVSGRTQSRVQRRRHDDAVMPRRRRGSRPVSRSRSGVVAVGLHGGQQLHHLLVLARAPVDRQDGAAAAPIGGERDRRGSRRGPWPRSKPQPAPPVSIVAVVAAARVDCASRGPGTATRRRSAPARTP